MGIMGMIDVCTSLDQTNGAAYNHMHGLHKKPGFEVCGHKPTGPENMFGVHALYIFLCRERVFRLDIYNRDSISRFYQCCGLTQDAEIRAHFFLQMHTYFDRGMIYHAPGSWS